MVVVVWILDYVYQMHCLISLPVQIKPNISSFKLLNECVHSEYASGKYRAPAFTEMSLFYSVLIYSVLISIRKIVISTNKATLDDKKLRKLHF